MPSQTVNALCPGYTDWKLLWELTDEGAGSLDFAFKIPSFEHAPTGMRLSFTARKLFETGEAEVGEWYVPADGAENFTNHDTIELAPVTIEIGGETALFGMEPAAVAALLAGAGMSMRVNISGTHCAVVVSGALLEVFWE